MSSFTQKIINNQSVRHFCRVHYKGVLFSIWLIERVCRILTLFSCISIIALPNSVESDNITIGQFVLYEMVSFAAAYFFGHIGFSDCNENEYKED